jgi:hypothetical protein
VKISDDMVFSIKRVMTTNSYFIKTKKEGVKVLSIDDLESKPFTLKQLFDVKEA